MKIGVMALGIFLVAGLAAGAQEADDGHFHLALPDQAGQISWQAEGFQIVESSAKPNGNEIGLRGKDATGRVTFWDFCSGWQAPAR